MQGRFYRGRVRAAGLDARPAGRNGADTTSTTSYMSELGARACCVRRRASGLLAIVAQMKAREGIDAVILGGTELPLILRDHDRVRHPAARHDGRFTRRRSSRGPWRSAAMALTATIYNFDIELADADRNRYESLNLRVARHPSESEDYLVTQAARLSARVRGRHRRSREACRIRTNRRCAIRDLTGAHHHVDRHRHARCARACTRRPSPVRACVVYTHKNPDQFLKQLSGEKIHRLRRAGALRDGPRAGRRARRAASSGASPFSVSITDRELYHLDRRRHAHRRRHSPHDLNALAFVH